MQSRPPFVPLCGGDPADTRNFDAEFTKLNVKDSTASGQEPDSVLEYEGFSFLDEEYRALRSHEHGSSTDLRQHGSSTDLQHGSILPGESSMLSSSYINSLKMYDDDTDMLNGGDNDEGNGPIDF